jgi:FKBP-type peptidyl-prolyl cis-trans isomerase FkpA
MMRTTTTLLLAIILFASCNQYKKTPSGLAYKITKGDGKVKLKNGMFVKFNIEYKMPPKDSVLNSSFGRVPAFLVIDTLRPSRHNFTEIITQCAVGDKIEFTMSVDTLKKLGMVQYDNIFHPRDMIKGRVEILKAYNTQEEAIADRNKEIEAELGREKKELAEYAAGKKIKTQATASGALVEIQTPGDLTAMADTGKMASVRYKGTLLKGGNGLPFDTNMGPAGEGKPPLMVLVGSVGTGNSVIPGLDQALRLFGKGGKGKVYIPAMAGYGDAGSPPVIPPYASLVFEIEVIDVTTPAAQPKQPAMPQLQK